MDNEIIIKRLNQLISQRKSQDDTMQQIERYVVPFRGEFFSDMHSEQQVNWRRRSIFDSTAIQACQTLAASIQGSLTSAAIKWFILRFRDEELNEDHASKMWLQDTEQRIYAALQESNFDMESSEFYLDLCSFGTGILTEEEVMDASGNFEGIDFSSAPIRDCYFEHDANGGVLRFYRQYQWTALQIFDKFTKKGMPPEIFDLIDANADVEKKFDIVFAIYNRLDKVDADTTTMLADLERPFGYKWVMEKDGVLLGAEGGYFEMPSFAARWRKVNGSRWGHSPATVALSDIMTLNELVEATLEALAKVVDPATLTTERGLLSDLDLGRGGLTVVRDIETSLKPYESRARFDVADMKIERLQESINKAFFVDQLELKQSPAMTATEVQVRYELIQRLLGPTLGRLAADYLDPLIKRTFRILYRNDQLAEMPTLVKEKKGQYEIEYTGPLPRAQKQEVATSVLNWLGVVGQLAETFPAMMDNVDEDAVVIGLAEMSSVPAKFRRDPKKIKKLRAKRAEEEATMKQAAAAEAVGTGMEALGKGQAALPGGIEGSG